MIFPMAEAMRIGPGASVRLAGAVAQLEEHGAPRSAELDLLETLPGQPQHTRPDDEAAVGGSDHPVPAERVHQPVDRRTREGSRCAELTRAEGPPGASKRGRRERIGCSELQPPRGEGEALSVVRTLCP